MITDIKKCTFKIKIKIKMCSCKIIGSQITTN